VYIYCVYKRYIPIQPLFNPAVSSLIRLIITKNKKMNYLSNVQERKYREANVPNAYSVQTPSMMYEMAMRLSLLPGSHIGDYSKEVLKEPGKHYEGKTPKNQPEPNSNYQFANKFSIN